MIKLPFVALLFFLATQAAPPQQPPPQPPPPAAPQPGRGQPPTPPPGTTNNPFPEPIAATEGVITVKFREFASLPDNQGQASRMMTLVDEPGTKRLFVSDMTGPVYTVSYDGKSVALYLDVNDPSWGIGVQSQGAERGVQSFAMHPQFAQRGT